MICFCIDELTSCLKNVQTGDIVETEVITLTRKSFLAKFNKKTGWFINWSQFDKGVVVKALVLKGTVDIQGLIAMKDEPDAQAVHILWACTSPNNNVWLYGKKEYSGVGGHLFAVAGRFSVELGYGGFVYGEAMDAEIEQHYINRYGAQHFAYGEPPHEYRIIISEGPMAKIMEEYTYDETDEQI